MSVIGFDAIAYRMYPVTDGAFVSMLTAGTETAAMRNRITVIDDNDGLSWTVDTNGDGIFWSQTYWVHAGYSQWGGTNWEDGLRMPFFDDSMTAFPTTPDLVVFVTDGQPNTVRYSTYDQGIDALTAAQMMANRGRETGADIIGVIVGTAASDTGSVNNMKAIVGPVEYDAAANGGQGNAATADLYRASMSNVAPGPAHDHAGAVRRHRDAAGEDRRRQRHAEERAAQQRVDLHDRARHPAHRPTQGVVGDARLHVRRDRDQQVGPHRADLRSRTVRVRPDRVPARRRAGAPG